METDKPLISIVMAVYHPRTDWLIEQLDSLNAQNYPNLELIICDDGPDNPAEELLFAQHITAFPWRLIRNETNLGSTKTFERLTGLVQGKYIAYCDQDDVWLPEKLTCYQQELEKTAALLVCSDMYVIDAVGHRTAGSITAVRKRHIFRSGPNLAPALLVSNFVTGCAMMVLADAAKTAIPFCPDMVHDHYLALFCASRGCIAFIDRPLISYRIHASNQTLVMAGVTDKNSYLNVRIRVLERRLIWLQEAFQADAALAEEVRLALLWVQARHAAFLGDLSARKIVWEFRRFSKMTSLFELVLASCPEKLFLFFIQLIRKNVL